MLTALASTSSSPSLLSALGLNWQLFIEQGVAFAILLWILAKFVYPTLIKSIDSRREQIEAGLQEAKESQVALEKAEAQVAELLATARQDADALLARSHTEAAAMVADAESKAKTRAEQIVADAREQLALDVTKARESLKAETVKLVAAATEHLLHEKIDDKKDATLIKQALATAEKERA